jgi:hypothetical protein
VADSLEKSPRFVAGATAIHQSCAGELAAQENIVGYGKLIHQVQFLMDHHNAQLYRARDTMKANPRPVNKQIAGSRTLYAREHLHERAFAGAVFADEAMDFTRQKLQINVVERTDASESFGKVFD